MNKRIVITGSAVLVLALALAGCSGGSASSTGASSAQTPAAVEGTQAAASASASSSAAAGYWTEQRLLAAQEFRPDDWTEPEEGSTPAAQQNAKTLRIGALFDSDSSGGHFCTASVVNSPGHNVIVTAAHCLNSGNGGASKQNVAFIPAYADGKTPYGVWTPDKYFIDPRWVSSHDDNLDVAFLTLKPYEGKNIQDVLGGNTMAFSSGYQHKVRVTGYPASDDAPVTCDNNTGEQPTGFLQFPCANFYGGTSGSPFLTDYNAQTNTGTIVGVLGGYEEGGSTADISYSDNLGDDIKKLYDQAIGQ
jgi:V8-like Glu-specific endopeptidase